MALREYELEDSRRKYEVISIGRGSVERLEPCSVIKYQITMRGDCEYGIVICSHPNGNIIVAKLEAYRGVENILPKNIDFTTLSTIKLPTIKAKCGICTSLDCVSMIAPMEVALSGGKRFIKKEYIRKNIEEVWGEYILPSILKFNFENIGKSIDMFFENINFRRLNSKAKKVFIACFIGKRKGKSIECSFQKFISKYDDPQSIYDELNEELMNCLKKHNMQLFGDAYKSQVDFLLFIKYFFRKIEEMENSLKTEE